MSLFSNSKDQEQVYSTPKHWKYLYTRPLIPYFHTNYDAALLNFRLFLKLGALWGWEPRASCPLPLLAALTILIIKKQPTLDYHVWDIFFRWFRHKPQHYNSLL